MTGFAKAGRHLCRAEVLVCSKGARKGRLDLLDSSREGCLPGDLDRVGGLGVLDQRLPGGIGDGWGGGIASRLVHEVVEGEVAIVGRLEQAARRVECLSRPCECGVQWIGPHGCASPCPQVDLVQVTQERQWDRAVVAGQSCVDGGGDQRGPAWTAPRAARQVDHDPAGCRRPGVAKVLQQLWAGRHEFG
jgi:hypothetical protein